MSSANESKDVLIKKVGFNEYFSANQWADYNRKFFNHLAPRYDYLNEVITLGMQKRYKSEVIRRSPISDGDLVLDICTGSGDMAILTAQMFPHSHVIGVDVAEKMLEIAREKTKSQSNIEFRLGDAMALPYEDHMFDVSMMSYGLRNLTDFRRGIMEMKRITKTDGHIIIVDLGKPEGFFNTMIYNIYFENIMPFLGRHVFHRGEFNSFKYLPESNKFFPSAEGLKAVLQECGIRNIKTYSHMMGIVSQQIGLV